MNKIYKLKFDKRRNELVVVSEITAGLGKAESTGHIAGLLALPFRKLLGTLSPLSLMTGLALGVLPMMALANPNLPTGGQIVGGQGSISVAGNQMTIHQGSQNMAANWNSFDIGKNNTVQFVQPNSSAVALNRVIGGHESQIMGNLNANGKVFLINPNGVLFGKGASINTAGLVASTKNINTADFMKGNYTFSGGSAPGAEIINQGTLTTTKNGFIVLAANRVKNSGHIITASGKAVLAAADTVALQLDNSGLTSVAVNGSVVNALVDNRGLISATNGQVYLTARGKDMLLNTVVNNSGTIEAKGLSTNGGMIRLDGGDSGVVNQSGQLLAGSETGKGGRITLEGQNIHLADKSLTSVTGKNGGGDVYVGGGWQGKDSHIKNASKVVMDKSATVDVSATQSGNGGQAVLWSDDYTNFQGTILAKGGKASGNGGQVETSSHNNLQAFGRVDASSARGKGGQWLLDPTDVTIVGTGSDVGVSSSTTDNNSVFSPTASGAQILNTSINNQLNAVTGVTIKTNGTDVSGQSGNITVNAAIEKTAGSDTSLSLEADGNITINQNITSTSGKLNINLLGAGSFTSRVQVLNSKLLTLGGNITIDQLNHAVTNAAANPNAMTANINNKSILDTSGADINAAKGNITINGYNPNVNLGSGEFRGTVRNGNTMVQIAGGSQLTGNNIRLYSEQDGKGNALLYPVFINNVNLSADGNISLTGLVTNSSQASNLELRGNNILTAGGNITVESNLTDAGTRTGVYLNGNGSALTILTAGENINISGRTGSGTGVQIKNVTLNATAINILGAAKNSGTGFNLSGISSNTSIDKLGLSSAGSGATVTNSLDNSLIGADASKTAALLQKHIENLTNVDMNGTAIFDDGAQAWDQKYQTNEHPNAGWIFNNTTVNASNADLSGVGFTNSSLNMTAGDLIINNNGSVLLTNSIINALQGAVKANAVGGGLTLGAGSITAKGDINLQANNAMLMQGANLTSSAGAVTAHTTLGNLDLTSGNISANKDINLHTENGTLTFKGKNSASVSTITSTAGDINVTASNLSSGRATGIFVVNTDMLAGSGNISINGTTPGVYSGVRLSNSNIKANDVNGTINIYAQSAGVGDTNTEKGSLYLEGSNNLTAGEVLLYGRNTGIFTGVGIAFDFSSNTSFYGNTNITGYGESSGVSYWNSVVWGFYGAKASVSGYSTGKGGNNTYYGTAGILSNQFRADPVLNIDLHGTDLSMLADVSSTLGSKVTGFGMLNLGISSSAQAGINFKGNGNVSVLGIATDGDGLSTEMFSNAGLIGNVSLSGKSDSGTGVVFRGNVKADLTNVTVTGTSNTGEGVVFNASYKNSVVNLDNNTIIGASNVSTGINVNGNNVSITNGSLNGTSGGAGSGINLTGGNNYNFSGVNISGQSVDGAGIRVSGNLSVNDQTSLNGTSSGSGDGVVVSGSLQSEGGVTISGHASEGNGVSVSGETTLNNATLSGTTQNGAGVNITGNLTNTGNTSVAGSASGNGAGVDLGGNVTGGSVSGDSAEGTGVVVSGND
ncbi:TPA: filamentous hemagglutinin N-terminal domain-containing protein, partial [Salmonella enterica]|nr:filamentous hemagglutinin N-terminal domain-containing protein [Salmonella enterica]HBM0507987.1 filamentous hemagglutinin N-terminal domain-containing protein [Salmonella enterica]